MLGSKVIIELGNGPKQDGTADCGLFAIATSVSLATGRFHSVVNARPSFTLF